MALAPKVAPLLAMMATVVTRLAAPRLTLMPAFHLYLE